MKLKQTKQNKETKTYKQIKAKQHKIKQTSTQLK